MTDPAAAVGRAEQRRIDAKRARELAEDALNRRSRSYNHIGPDALLAAALVYATLATAP